jgi:hypothetical protein
MSLDLVPSTLDECEGIIERGLATFMEVGAALLRIRDERLYRSEYRDFETYCQNRWSMGRREANRLIEASDITNALGAIAPKNIGQARELSGLDTETAAAVMTEAHAATNGKPTAKTISDIRSKLEAPAPAGQYEARAAYMAAAAANSDDDALTEEECEALDAERPDDILTEEEWQAAGDDEPDDAEPEDFAPFIANVQKAFYTFALAEKRFSTDRIAEVAQADPQFAVTLRQDITRARRWLKQLDTALRP